MGKLIEHINSDTIDKNALWYLRFGTSFGTWLLIFFFIVPALIFIAKNIFGITHQGSSTVSGIIDLFLYYILNPVIATLVVKWQNRKLDMKTLKFRKIYSLVLSFFFSILVLIRILGHFTAKT